MDTGSYREPAKQKKAFVVNGTTVWKSRPSRMETLNLTLRPGKKRDLRVKVNLQEAYL